jgi:hypothetical protein
MIEKYTIQKRRLRLATENVQTRNAIAGAFSARAQMQ